MPPGIAVDLNAGIRLSVAHARNHCSTFLRLLEQKVDHIAITSLASRWARDAQISLLSGPHGWADHEYDSLPDFVPPHSAAQPWLYIPCLQTMLFILHTLNACARAGNHYAEIQVVDAIYDEAAAAKMGIDKIGQ
eukprot:scaffold140026_cov22-Tisochrysis_lutea.AAC.1